LNLFKEELRERYPVYETSLDNIIGVVSMKQLLNRLATDEESKSSTRMASLPVSEVMMPPYFVPDTMRLSTLLKDFTSNRRQMAIVLDEYGGTEGLITLDDILEEIVGDYEDEFTPRHRHIKMEDKQHFIINGGVRVTELEPKLNFPFPTGDYVTLGGLIHHNLGRIAGVDDVVQLVGGNLTVLEMDNHRITKVLFEFEDVQEESEGDVPSAEVEKTNPETAKLSSKEILKDKADAPETRKSEAAGKKKAGNKAEVAK